jgi:heme exporter protein CcmD
VKDYSFYIAAAWVLTAVVLGGLVLLSFWQARAAEQDAPWDANA